MNKQKDTPSIWTAEDYIACLDRIDFLSSVPQAAAERILLEKKAEEFEQRLLSPGVLSVK